ncbi:MAG: HAD family hydrolase, partial [Acidobacteria bacterium]|nr:HAD family hydrolase [Acidobacteriota bacterium]
MDRPNRNSLIPAESLSGLAVSPASSLLRHTLADRPPAEALQVYVNRTLRMERIRYIGFDLDWTLADYDEEELSALAFRLLLERLVESFGYPREIYRAEFRPRFARRGLMIDTEVGAVLKMNRHRYVGRAYHGREFLGAGERAKHYRLDPLQPASERFYFVDTLFELPEVHLFTELVELKKKGLQLPSYRRLFDDGRAAIDSIHADGTLKTQILADLPRYLPRDPGLLLALHRLALDGRKLLLITNSE